MNIFTKLSKKIALFIAIAFATVLFVANAGQHVAAIPYSGDSTPPASGPQFNVYTGVPEEGNESDFFRGKVAGNPQAVSTNVVDSTCENGQQFTLRVYVHNGATESLNGNGDGPSVAKDTKVKVNLNNANAQSQFVPDATISSSNAGSVNDDMTIRCSDGRVVKLSYVDNTATQFTRAGSKPIDDDALFTTGALVGTDNPDGNVWGCWSQRVYVTFNVVVEEAPKPVTPSYVCKVTDVKVDDVKTRKVTAIVNGTVTNGATIVGYEINWGDGSKSNKQTDSHAYAKDGSYTIVGRVQVKLPNGEVKWVDSNNCVKVVKFENGQPVTPVTPVAPTTTLPNTGPGEILGLFSATSAAGAVAHRVYSRKKRGL